MELNNITTVSESGGHLKILLSHWMKKSLDFGVSMLKRLLLVYPFTIENPEETQLEPVQEGGSNALPRAQLQMVTGVSHSYMNEVAGTMDDTVLESILKWAEAHEATAATGKMGAFSVPDSTPIRPTMTFASMLSSGRHVSQRERTVSFRSSWKYCGRLSVCRQCNNVMVTFPSGHIRVYDSINLHRQALLPCFNERSKVHSVECTCSQIIALYEEGSICSWAVKNGELKARIWVRGSGGGDDLPFRMRYINSKLVVATKEGTIHVYQYINSTFTRLGCWHVTGIRVSRIEFDLYYVILQDVYTFAAQVYYPNGEFVQRIESNNVEAMAYHKGKLITGDKDQVLNIWEVRTGTLLHKLKGHNDAVDSIHIVEKNIVISGSHSSGVGPYQSVGKKFREK